METRYLKIKFSNSFNIFLLTFGVLCFAFVIASINYINEGMAKYNFYTKSLVHMFMYFLVINTVVSIFVSRISTKLSVESVYSFLNSIVVYFLTAQIYFYFFRKTLHPLSASLIGITISIIFFLLFSFKKLDFISYLIKVFTNLSSIVFVFLLIFNSAKLLNQNKNNHRFDNLEEVYSKFKKSKKKKPSVFFIIFDEVPFTFVSDGAVIKNSFPNLKELSEKSLFFTKAFSNYDITNKSLQSILTGKYYDRSIPRSGYYTPPSLFLKKRNLVADLENCDYNIQILGDILKISSVIPTMHAETFYSEQSLIVGTLNFIAKLYSFRHVKPLGYYVISRAISDNKIIEGIDFRKKSENPFLYLIHFCATHCPYVYDEDGKDNSGKEPNSYFSDKWSDRPLKLAPLVNKRHLETLTFCDKVLGKLINNILDSFDKDNIMIVFLSDHGIGWRAPRLGRAMGFVNWDIVGVPLMIYSPNNLKRGVYDKAFPMIDLLPTLYDLLGIEYKEKEFDGISLFNKKRNLQRDIFSDSSYNGMVAKYFLENDSWQKVN